MWPFSKKEPEVDKELEAISKRYKVAEAFAKKGDFVLYLGVKMLVVGHHDFNSYCYNTPSIRVEWMDKANRLQKASIRDWEFSLCEVISTSENKGVSKSTPNTTKVTIPPCTHSLPNVDGSDGMTCGKCGGTVCCYQAEQ